MEHLEDQLILSYCTSKGIDTTGLTPLEAILLQLKIENPLQEHSQISQVRFTTITVLTPDQIIIPNTLYYEQVAPKAPLPAVKDLDTIDPSKTVLSIAGVVYRDAFNRFVLMDGYHRMKYIQSQSNLSPNSSLSQHFYILLSKDVPIRENQDLNHSSRTYGYPYTK